MLYTYIHCVFQYINFWSSTKFFSGSYHNLWNSRHIGNTGLWTLGLWTPGHLDAWKLGLWTPGRLDTGQPNAWTLDLWTLGPHVRIFKDLIVKLILWTAIVSNVAIFRSFIYRKKFLLWEIELSIFKHPSRKSGCRVLVLVKLKTDCSE